MTEYRFYAAILRFVAGKTGRDDARVAAMMDSLNTVAAEVEARGGFQVAPDRLELTARALAGVAAFLQKRILPEVVAEANSAGEAQVRWAIDTAMEGVNRLLSQAAQAAQGGTAGEAVRIALPPPPAPHDK
ncbi:hypothetical protein GALL_155520 [mine drainage metagenome]|uniref:Uncharacterized protein n=1 Tax=mine drainage metagenome TaxID=410659 RepID=A0A1J5S2U5_9ZZZZ